MLVAASPIRQWTVVLSLHCLATSPLCSLRCCNEFPPLRGKAQFFFWRMRFFNSRLSVAVGAIAPTSNRFSFCSTITLHASTVHVCHFVELFYLILFYFPPLSSFWLIENVQHHVSAIRQYSFDTQWNNFHFFCACLFNSICRSYSRSRSTAGVSGFYRGQMSVTSKHRARDNYLACLAIRHIIILFSAVRRTTKQQLCW